MKKVIGIVLIVAGLCLAAFSIYAKLNTNTENTKAIEQFEKGISKNKGKQTSDIKLGKDDFKDGIGILIIPKIDLKVIIKDGTDIKTIKHAVGHFEKTPMPWEKGNFCIAGHNQNTYGEFFNRVDEIQEGDKIKVKTKQGNFDYTITDKKIIEPTNLKVIENIDGDCLTIVTCTNNGKKRIAIRAIKI